MAENKWLLTEDERLKVLQDCPQGTSGGKAIAQAQLKHVVARLMLSKVQEDNPYTITLVIPAADGQALLKEAGLKE